MKPNLVAHFSKVSLTRLRSTESKPKIKNIFRNNGAYACF